jgi:hypothetical protein
VLPKSISASDVGQTFLSAGSGDFPVPGFRVKLSALVREIGKLRNRQARKPTVPERGCVEDQPQQLRKTSLLKYA